MKINKIHIENFKSLKDATVSFPDKIAIVVGDNEVGKTTLLEAINLGLTAQLNGRHIGYELHPYLFNSISSSEYLSSLLEGTNPMPPRILVELYFAEHDELGSLKGSINSTGEDCPGVSLTIEFDPKFEDEYANYIANPADVTSIPIEYMKVVWRTFADQDITARSLPVRCSLIDATTVRHDLGANRYLTEVMANYLEPHDLARLGLSYRKMKDLFLGDPSITAINTELEKAKGTVSDKTISIGLDNTARAKWEAGVIPHLDDIPFSLVGKGEQTSTKIKLALEKAEGSRVILVEEPENHQSHTNLSALLESMFGKAGENQIIVSTHSSFVLNKLGLDGTVLFDGEAGATLMDLPEDTKNYFLKLSGHDTLRLILSKRAILVEGPSDELLVQRAYKDVHGVLPLADGTEIISVRSLAFKRFLDIARLLNIDIRVITDNDGDVAKLKKKYGDYLGADGVLISFDDDEGAPTLEPQLVKYNGRNLTNKILGKDFATDEQLVEYMEGHKTDCALKFFESETAMVIPDYIQHAIAK
ncbi:ATP-dependent nuclease [Roseovarius rhodophyticola]|uniref:AAA family ATPase n=1 Tax=Roseovarius rhodophyticola TaxID=3080827 RepID=A0ABZ2TJF9_9RHOB|nr:AAA family ATPase [Roseovarius sp. W115]MDV2930167.1 AAA family ATPase [Roseovarius sp. W115]